MNHGTPPDEEEYIENADKSEVMNTSYVIEESHKSDGSMKSLQLFQDSAESDKGYKYFQGDSLYRTWLFMFILENYKCDRVKIAHLRSQYLAVIIKGNFRRHKIRDKYYTEMLLESCFQPTQMYLISMSFFMSYIYWHI